MNKRKLVWFEIKSHPLCIAPTLLVNCNHLEIKLTKIQLALYSTNKVIFFRRLPIIL